MAAADSNASRAGVCSTPIRVLCVDDRSDNRAALRMLIDGQPVVWGQREMECVGELDSADRLVDEARRLAPDVVLLDATMPGRSPFEAMGEMARALPDTRTVVCSGHDDRAFQARAMQAGAWRCVSKHDSPERIIDAVRDAAEDATFGRDE